MYARSRFVVLLLAASGCYDGGELETIGSIEEALATPEPRIHDYGDGGNVHKAVSMRFGDVEPSQASDRVDRQLGVGLVVEVVRRNRAGAEFGARVAALAGDELRSAVEAFDQQRLVAWCMPGCRQYPNTRCDVLVAVENSTPVRSDVRPLGDRVVR